MFLEPSVHGFDRIRRVMDHVRALLVPPLVGACIQPDISSVTNVTGCFGLFLCAVVPGVLSLAARRLAPGPTEHASPLNGKAAAVALVLVGLVLTAGSLAAAL